MVSRKEENARRVQNRKKSLSTEEASKDFTEGIEFGLNLERCVGLEIREEKSQREH